MNYSATEMKRILIATLGAILITASAALLPSCAKSNEDHELTVQITVNDSVRVSNCLVHLYVPVSDSYIKDWYDYTNEEGEVHYSFENKVIVQIIAAKGTFKSCSFAEVEEGANRVVVDLKPYCAKDNGCEPCQ